MIQYTDSQKLEDARRIAKNNNCFIAEYRDGNKELYKVFRKGEQRNFFIGQRKTISTLLSFVKKACVTV